MTTIVIYGNLKTHIQVDANDKIHIATLGGYPSVQYITNASGGWVISNIAHGSSSMAMALDSNNKAHVVYYVLFSSYSREFEMRQMH
jgi:hypothetical protein